MQLLQTRFSGSEGHLNCFPETRHQIWEYMIAAVFHRSFGLDFFLHKSLENKRNAAEEHLNENTSEYGGSEVAIHSVEREVGFDVAAAAAVYGR